MDKKTPQEQIETVVSWLMECSDKSLSHEEQFLEVRRKLLNMGITLHNGDPEKCEIKVDSLDQMIEKIGYDKNRTPERDAIVSKLVDSSQPFADANLFDLEEKYAGEKASDDVFVVRPTGRIALTAEALRECLLRIASGKSGNPDGTGQNHNQAEDLPQSQAV